jgi:hypothetical protein
MFQSLIQDIFHMVIGQGIEDGLSIPAEFDQAVLLQDTELMGDGAWSHGKLQGDVVDAELPIQEQIQDLNACGIAEYFIKFRKVINLFFCGHMCFVVHGNLRSSAVYTGTV